MNTYNRLLITFTSLAVLLSLPHSMQSHETPPPDPGDADVSQAPCDEFVTGGGWITGTPSGGKANFSIQGGLEDGEPFGHVNYVRRFAGSHLHT